MANKDFYDRIADALEILAGDSSHINDDYPTIDYYSRIADALETIANSGISGDGGNSCNCSKLIVTAFLDNNVDGRIVLDKTWQQIYDVFSIGGQVRIISDEGTLINAIVQMDTNNYQIKASSAEYYTNSASGYPETQVIK